MLPHSQDSRLKTVATRPVSVALKDQATDTPEAHNAQFPVFSQNGYAQMAALRLQTATERAVAPSSYGWSVGSRHLGANEEINVGRFRGYRASR